MDSDEVKNLISLASGSSASDPDESFSYFVAGKTIREILGYNADATRLRMRDSLDEYFERLETSLGDVDGIRPASCSAER